jgi:hypothetical protein
VSIREELNLKSDFSAQVCPRYSPFPDKLEDKDAAGFIPGKMRYILHPVPSMMKR